MKKLLLFAILTGVLAGLTGCNDEAAQKEAEKKAKREHMKQHVDTSGEKKSPSCRFRTIMKQQLHFADNKTYFAVDIYRYGVKVGDLEKLPFFDLFVKYHEEKIFLTNGEEQYVPVIDWESFCYDYVMHGNYRNIG